MDILSSNTIHFYSQFTIHYSFNTLFIMRLDQIAKEYGGRWTETNREKLEGLEDVKKIVVEERDFQQDDGSWKTVVSMNFMLVGGKSRYKQISNTSALCVGDVVDPNSVEVITLSREGDDDIFRLDGKAVV